MQRTLLCLAAIVGAVSCYYYPAAWNQVQVPVTPVPRCELGNQLRYLPMYIVPETQLNVVQDYRTRFYTPAPALVSLVGQSQPLPAVRVVLDQPIHVSSWKSFIEFPTSFTIFQDGYRLPFPVSAVYAPLATSNLYRRPYVDIVYAVPAAGLSSAPVRVTTTTTAAPPPYSPQNITVLHFPEQLAEPQVVYQEEDDELGGRNPPLPVIPAGIVQSAAPTPDVTLFINSKESPVLQLLRDEANRQKNIVRAY